MFFYKDRIVPGSFENIVETLKWSGLVPDEGPTFGGDYGPYIQSERNELYCEMINKLLNGSKVYRCFCSSKRLDLLRREATKNRETVRYDNRCRHLSSEEIDQYLNDNRPYTVRLKLKPGAMVINDLVFGSVSYDLVQLEGDPIIFKSDGTPTYHFANVVDDHFMRISHVLRGVEWLVSTPKHLMLYEAFGWTAPQYAHLPLLINQDGSKLSKRNNHLQIEHYRQCGYYPETIMNFLGQLGGGLSKLYDSDPNRIFTLNEQSRFFDLKTMSQNYCKIDPDKIKSLNSIYLKDLFQNDFKRVHRDFLIFLEQKNLQILDHQSDDYVEKILKWSSNRINSLNDLFTDEFLFLWVQPSLTWSIDGFGTSAKNLGL